MLNPTSPRRLFGPFSAPFSVLWRILPLLVVLVLPGLAIATLAGLGPQEGAPAPLIRPVPPAAELADNAAGTPASATDTLPFLPLPEGALPFDGSLSALLTSLPFNGPEQTLPVGAARVLDPAALPAPEPSALLLLAVGIGLLWLVRRKH